MCVRTQDPIVGIMSEAEMMRLQEKQLRLQATVLAGFMLKKGQKVGQLSIAGTSAVPCQ